GRITYGELRGTGVLADGAPLDPGGEARASSPAEPGPPYFFDDLVGWALHRFRQALPAAGADVGVERGDRFVRQQDGAGRAVHGSHPPVSGRRFGGAGVVVDVCLSRMFLVGVLVGLV